MIEKYKDTIENAFGIKINGMLEKNPQTDIERQKAIHDFMDKEGERVISVERMKQGEVYATILGGDNIRVFMMPDEGNIVGAPDFTDVYTDFYEIQSLTDKDSRISGIVRDGKVRLRETISFSKVLGVYHLNGHSEMKDEILEKLKQGNGKNPGNLEYFVENN